jgi:LPS-assembly protein
LLQQARLGYSGRLGKSGILQFSAQAQQYQTVQDPARPAGAPYKKLPQILLRATQRDVFGVDLDLSTSYTEFAHKDEKTDPNKVAGKRYTFFPNVSKPIENSFGFITPKFGLHHTGYMLNRSTGNIPDKNISRTIPIMSLDSGLTATRETKIFGEGFNQTVEPRLFYVYVPYKNQSHIPKFDTGVQGFSFGRIFSENKFSGNDRINDANRVTLSLTSRLIDENTGVERFRVAVAKQVHLTKPRVGVVADPKRNSDVIFSLNGKITPNLTAKHEMQIDQSKGRTDVMRSMLSYQPEIGKVINLGYRYTRGVLAQYDISAQWPITKRLRLVARKNYSLRKTRALSELIGLEYNACCWTIRFVGQKLRTSSTRTNTTFFLQLELGGLLQVGSDPLKILTRGIQGYTNFDGRRNENDDSELRLVKITNITFFVLKFTRFFASMS